VVSRNENHRSEIRQHHGWRQVLLLLGLKAGSSVKLEMDDVTVLNNVVSAFLLVLASSLHATLFNMYESQKHSTHHSRMINMLFNSHEYKSDEQLLCITNKTWQFLFYFYISNFRK